jgi:hypothetical protein
MSLPGRRALTLIVPGLFGPAPPPGADAGAALDTLVSGLDLRPLETLLSRARAVAAAGSWESPEDLVFSAFGYPRPAGDWPAAALSRLADTGESAPGQWWLRADPVHLKADTGDLILFDGRFFNLDPEEATDLAKTVEAHFSELGWRLEVAHPLRWYLKPETPARIRTTPLSMARLRKVDAQLPGGDDGRQWHALLNETQMVLHDCAVNRARDDRGEPPVNSLWFWGGGALPPARPAEWSQVHGDSVLLSGLARHTGVPSGHIPDDAGTWLGTIGEGRHLALIETGHGPARASDVEAWREFIAGLSANWFDPLRHALADGSLHSVTVLTDRHLGYHAQRTRWWHRLTARRTFSRLARS